MGISDSQAATDFRVPTIATISRLPRQSLWFALAVAIIGAVVLLSWSTGIEALKTVLPGLVTMKVNTAVSLILLSVALAATNRPGRGGTIIVFGSILICAAIALTTLGEDLFKVDLHIDNLLVKDTVRIAYPGRMAPATIFCFVLYSIGLLLLEIRRWIYVAQIAMVAVIGVSLATLGGYLYGAPQMIAHAPYAVVAMHTAIGLVLLAIGGLIRQPTQGPMRVMMADTTGGWIAHRLIPTALAVPLAVGLGVVTGQRAGIYGPAFAVALTVSADIAVMTVVIWSVSSLLSRSDARRQITEQAVIRHSELKDEFLATLSHELRTPLTAVLGWAIMLARRENLDADMQEGLSVIERNARAQTQIIEDLLDMSRIIAGKMRLEPQRIHLGKVIADAVQTARPSADAKGIQLQLTIDPEAPAVLGDPYRIGQIAWNLLSNAVKFTPKGGWVRVILSRNASQLQLVVEDSGQGIKKEFLPHLFERFRQADASATRRHGGLGLGLSIVRQLVELHGGTVKAESRGEGLGSTFTLGFPIPAIEQNTIIEKSRENLPDLNIGNARISQATANAVKGLRVLVVDDESDARSLIRRVLEDCQAIVVTEASADDAMARLDAEQSDVLVCDIGMPQQDGYDLIRAIRRREMRDGGNLPAAALTAFARSEDRARALSSGFQIHTVKPIEPSELIAAVASLATRKILSQSKV